MLKHVPTGKGIPLAHHTRVGRTADADLRIEDKRISSEHALLSWTNGIWEVRDLGSRNGTVVDGMRLEPGRRVPIRRGVSLKFGSPDHHFTLESDAEPDVVAVCLDGDEILEGEHGHLQLSDNVVLLTEDGTDYFLQRKDEREKVEDRQVVEVDSTRFRLLIPPASSLDGQTATAEGVLLPKGVALRFEVSPDEEHVQVHLIAPGVSKILRPRSFDFMLLVLARARLADDGDPDTPEEERGWVYVDELAKDLGLDVSHINVDIYRARRRFASAGVQGADDMLNRRTHTRAVRLGCGKVEVV
jgi:pSer/pThr/pTyr-binding forkhead associated (FHA) protein